MITSNSRYVDNTLSLVTGSDGLQRTTILPTEPEATQFSFMLHVVSGYDRLDTLANTYLGDASLWWQIADINPDVTIDWSIMPVGATIRIPVQ